MLLTGACFSVLSFPPTPPTFLFAASVAPPTFDLIEPILPIPAPLFADGGLFTASALCPAEAAVGLVIRSRKLPEAGLPPEELPDGTREPGCALVLEVEGGGRAVLADVLRAVG